MTRAGRCSRQTAERRAAPAPARDRARARGVLLRLALTGLLGIGYEVLVVRVLSQVTEDTVYTFAMLLAVYLVGSAAGAAGYQRWLERRRDRDGAAAIGCSARWRRLASSARRRCGRAEHVKALALRRVRRQHGARRSPPRRRWRSSPSGRRRS